MAADVSLVVDVDTNKATRGIDALKRGVDDLATKGVGKLNTAFQTMLGNLGAQVASKVGAIAIDSVMAAFDIQKSAQQVALNLGISRQEAEKAIGGISGGGRDTRAVGQIVAKLSRGGGDIGEITKVADAIVSMGEAMGRTTPADLFSLAEAYDTVMDRFKSGLEETSSAIGTMLTKGEMEPGDIAGFAETMRGRKRTLEQVTSLVSGAAEAGMGKQLRRLVVSDKGRDKATLRRFMESGAKGMTQEELAQRRQAMLSLSGEKAMRVIPAVTSSFGEAISKNIDAALGTFSPVSDQRPGELIGDAKSRELESIGLSKDVAGYLASMHARANRQEWSSIRTMQAQEQTARATRATADASAK